MNSLKTRGVLGGLRILAAGFVDLARARLGLSPAYVKLAGPLGSLSLMQLTPSEFSRYTQKIPPSPRVRASISFNLLREKCPIKFLGNQGK